MKSQNQYILHRAISPSNRFKFIKSNQKTIGSEMISPKIKKGVENGKRPQRHHRRMKYIIWVPEKQIFDRILILSKLLPNKYMFCHNLLTSQIRDQYKQQKMTNPKQVQIISTLDAFTDIYLNLKNNKYIQCRKWIILSSAINSQSIQKSFNEQHSPIIFRFLSGIPAVCNHLLNFDKKHSKLRVCPIVCVIDQYSSKLGQKYKQLCFQQKFYGNFDENEFQIYSIEKIETLKKVQITRAYFMTGTQVFQNNCLNFKVDIPRDYKIIVLEQYFRINNLNQFYLYQNAFKMQIIDPKFIHKKALMNSRYTQRLLLQYLIPQNQLCLFYDKSGDKSQKIIDELLERANKKNIYFIPKQYYSQKLNSYYLQFQAKTNSNKFCITSKKQLNTQIGRILKFIQLKKNLIRKFEQNIEIFRKIAILQYNKDKSYHVLNKVFQNFNKKISHINSLDEIYQTDKITIIFGKFKYHQINSLKDFHNIFVFALEHNSDQNAPFWQIQQAQQVIKIANNAYSHFYGTHNHNMIVQAAIHIIYQNERSQQLIKKSFEWPEKLLKIHKISQFELCLNNLREYSKHLIFMQMQEFNETLQNRIKKMNWENPSSTSIDFYLKYGEQFIFRTKDGGFKFLKNTQIQQKINQIKQQFLIQPEPLGITPEPIFNQTAKQIIYKDNLVQQNSPYLDEQICEEQAYRYYVCIHRSIPHQINFRSKMKKQYIILVYSRIEEVINFYRLLNERQSILVVVNENSKQVYQKYLKKYRYVQSNFDILYCQQNYKVGIKKQIQLYLASKNMVIQQQQQRFNDQYTPLVLYNGFNQKACKVIRSIKKIFNHQLNLLLLKNAQFQELQVHNCAFKLDPQVKLFQFGSIARKQAKNIHNIKELFILCMQFQTKPYVFNLNQLKYSLKLFIGKTLYANFYKDYQIALKSKNTFVQKINRAKSQKSLFKNHQIYKSSKNIFRDKSQTPQRSRQNKPHNSRIVKSSSILTIKQTSDQRVSVLISSKCRSQYQFAQFFQNQSQLYLQIIKNQSYSKMNIVVLDQQDFQFYQIFECSNLYEMYNHIIWIICTHKQAKKVFQSQSVVFSDRESVKLTIQSIIKGYKIYYNSLNKLTIYEQNKVTNIVNHQTFYQKKHKSCEGNSQQNNYNEDPFHIFVRVSQQKNRTEKFNQIIFASKKCLNNFIENFKKTFIEGIINQGQYQIGNILYCPQNYGFQNSMMSRVTSIIGKLKEDYKVLVREYNSQKLINLLKYSPLRCLILYSHKNSEDFYGQLANSILIKEQGQNLQNIIQHMLVS